MTADEILANLRDVQNRLVKPAIEEDAHFALALAKAGCRIIPNTMLPDRRPLVMVPQDTYERFCALVKEETKP